MDGVYSRAQHEGWKGEILEVTGGVRGHGSGEGEGTGEIVESFPFLWISAEMNGDNRNNVLTDRQLNVIPFLVCQSSYIDHGV